MNIIIFTALENMCPLLNFDFLVNTKLTQVKILHSVLISFCVTAPTSFTCCEVRLVTNVLNSLCLHNRYIAKVVTSRDYCSNEQENIYYIIVREEILLVVKSVVHAFHSNKNFFPTIVLVKSPLNSLVLLVSLCQI